MKIDVDELEDSAKSLNQSDIDAVETQIGALPEPLNDFYLQVNGGTPNRCHLEGESEEEWEAHSFLGMRRKTHLNEKTAEEAYQRFVREWGAIPDDKTPFARDSGGDYYVMDRHDGKMFFWAHDIEDEELQLVAPSLEAMWERLETEDDFYEDKQP